MSYLIFNTDKTKAILLYLTRNEAELGLSKLSNTKKIYGRKRGMVGLQKIEGKGNILFDPAINQFRDIFSKYDQNDLFDTISIIMLLDASKIADLVGLSCFKVNCFVVSLSEVVISDYPKAKIHIEKDVIDLSTLKLDKSVNDIFCVLDHASESDKLKERVEDKMITTDLITISDTLELNDQSDLTNEINILSSHSSYDIIDQDSQKSESEKMLDDDQLSRTSKVFCVVYEISDLIRHFALHGMVIESVEDIVDHYYDILKNQHDCEVCAKVATELLNISCGSETSGSIRWLKTAKELQYLISMNVSKSVGKRYETRILTTEQLSEMKEFKYQMMFYLLLSRLDRKFVYIRSSNNSVPAWNDLCLLSELTQVPSSDVRLIDYYKTVFRGNNVPSNILIDFLFGQDRLK